MAATTASQVIQGSLQAIFNPSENSLNRTVSQPVLQCRKIKRVPHVPDRWSIVLSDMLNFAHGVLATRLSHVIHQGKLVGRCFVRLMDFMPSEIDGKRLLVINDLEVLQHVPKTGMPKALPRPEDSQPKELMTSAVDTEHQGSQDGPSALEREPASNTSGGLMGQLEVVDSRPRGGKPACNESKILNFELQDGETLTAEHEISSAKAQAGKPASRSTTTSKTSKPRLGPPKPPFSHPNPSNPYSTTFPPPSSFPNPILILLDFDSTLTTSSTLTPLLSLPMSTYGNYTRPICSYFPSTRLHTHHCHTRPATADELTDAYLNDLGAHHSSYQPRASRREALAQEFAFQGSLRPLERASFERGKRAFSDAGVTASDIEYAAEKALAEEEVCFGNEWTELLRAVFSANCHYEMESITIEIISTNWSYHWIHHLIHHAAQEDDLTDSEGYIIPVRVEQPKVKLAIPIHANTILPSPPSLQDPPPTSPPTSSPDPHQNSGIYVSADKARTMSRLISQRRDQIQQRHQLLNSPSDSNPAPQPELRTVYIGDSLGDLECLLRADVGIFLSDQDSNCSEQRQLSSALQRLGIAVADIDDFETEMERAREDREGGRQERQGPRLWRTRDLLEVVKNGVLGLVGGEDMVDRDTRWEFQGLNIHSSEGGPRQGKPANEEVAEGGSSRNPAHRTSIKP